VHPQVMYKASKAFTQRGLDAVAANADAVRADVEAFKAYVPLVQALRQPGMRGRHWEALSAQLGFTLNPDKAFTLQKAADMGLLGHLETITKVMGGADVEVRSQ
jgi:dynein heavy chain, axonemal